jgi:hypothetical protein
MTPMSRFLTMSGTASSERTSGLALIGVGVDVVFRRAHIVDKDGLALLRYLSDDTLPQLDAQAFDLGCVADLEAHAQVAGAVVEKQDGEDAVVDDGADQVGGPFEEGLKVEGGIERIGEAGEELRRKRLDADLTLSGYRSAGAIVALEAFVARSGECRVVNHKRSWFMLFWFMPFRAP